MGKASLPFEGDVYLANVGHFLCFLLPSCLLDLWYLGGVRSFCSFFAHWLRVWSVVWSTPERLASRCSGYRPRNIRSRGSGFYVGRRRANDNVCSSSFPNLSVSLTCHFCSSLTVILMESTNGMRHALGSLPQSLFLIPAESRYYLWTSHHVDIDGC